MTTIGARAFQNRTGLTSLAIPDSVTMIDHNAFYCCTGLITLTILDSVGTIGKNAFCNWDRFYSDSNLYRTTYVCYYKLSGVKTHHAWVCFLQINALLSTILASKSAY